MSIPIVVDQILWKIFALECLNQLYGGGCLFSLRPPTLIDLFPCSLMFWQGFLAGLNFDGWLEWVLFSDLLYFSRAPSMLPDWHDPFLRWSKWSGFFPFCYSSSCLSPCAIVTIGELSQTFYHGGVNSCIVGFLWKLSTFPRNWLILPPSLNQLPLERWIWAL